MNALNANGQDIASLERETYGVDNQEIARVIVIKLLLSGKGKYRRCNGYNKMFSVRKGSEHCPHRGRMLCGVLQSSSLQW